MKESCNREAKEHPKSFSGAQLGSKRSAVFCWSVCLSSVQRFLNPEHLPSCNFASKPLKTNVMSVNVCVMRNSTHNKVPDCV